MKSIKEIELYLKCQILRVKVRDSNIIQLQFKDGLQLLNIILTSDFQIMNFDLPLLTKSKEYCFPNIPITEYSIFSLHAFGLVLTDSQKLEYTMEYFS